ncbi:MAG: hypothetical protein M1838_001464 [Thelocarpon superellum]|nr:MAG: hypothetical protein M1838_001464 [Thelocarpon superellum]
MHLWDEPSATPFDIHRLKGRFHVLDGSSDPSSHTIKMIQGVREVFEIVDLPARSDVDEQDMVGDGAARIESASGKMVLIGRGIVDASQWQRSLDAAVWMP